MHTSVIIDERIHHKKFSMSIIKLEGTLSRRIKGKIKLFFSRFVSQSWHAVGTSYFIHSQVLSSYIHTVLSLILCWFWLNRFQIDHVNLYNFGTDSIKLNEYHFQKMLFCPNVTKFREKILFRIQQNFARFSWIENGIEYTHCEYILWTFITNDKLGYRVNMYTLVCVSFNLLFLQINKQFWWFYWARVFHVCFMRVSMHGTRFKYHISLIEFIQSQLFI